MGSCFTALHRSSREPTRKIVLVAASTVRRFPNLQAVLLLLIVNVAAAAAAAAPLAASAADVDVVRVTSVSETRVGNGVGGIGTSCGRVGNREGRVGKKAWPSQELQCLLNTSNSNSPKPERGETGNLTNPGP